MSVERNRLDELGNRMKAYERIETNQKFKPNSILYIRLDGRGFSKFTRGLKRPFDERLSNLMIDTTKYLVKEFNCEIGYVQSDEISLIIKNDYESPCIFEGKKQKLISTLAASCTAFFNRNLDYIPEKLEYGRLPTFDCRIFEVPNEVEAVNSLLWREKDAIKNSVSMAAHHYYSHKELQNKSSKVMIDMLLHKDIEWSDYPNFFKRGTYVKTIQYEKFSENGSAMRSKVDIVDMTLNLQVDISEKIKLVFGDKNESV